MRLRKYLLNWKTWVYFNRKLTVSVFIALCIISFLLFMPKITTIDCFVDSQICPDEISLLIHSKTPKNYLLLNKKNLIKEIIESGVYSKVNIRYSLSGKLIYYLYESSEFFTYNVALVQNTADFQVGNHYSSTSGELTSRFSEQLQSLVGNLNTTSLLVYSNGHTAPISTTSSQIVVVTSDKKDQQWYADTYRLMKVVSSYIKTFSVYVIENNIYFSQESGPDIVINVSANVTDLTKTLQSLVFINTIKKNPKVVDLRYTNPIIR